jgi:PEGA domain
VSGSAVSRSGSDNSRVGGGAAASSAFNYGNNGTSNIAIVNPTARDRNGRPAVGTAVARPEVPTGSGGYTVYSPFGIWSPWYGTGFGYNLGFTTYNPWYYGSTRWIYGRYGLWYDPWAFYPYDPFYYPGYYGGTGYYGGSGYSTSSYEKESAPPKSVVGAVRIKANESNAKVYVDGVLMGSVSDFDGLSHHLELEAGGHQLELRADGFQTVTKDINIESGKTTTERLTLKKK